MENQESHLSAFAVQKPPAVSSSARQLRPRAHLPSFLIFKTTDGKFLFPLWHQQPLGCEGVWSAVLLLWSCCSFKGNLHFPGYEAMFPFPGAHNWNPFLKLHSLLVYVDLGVLLHWVFPNSEKKNSDVNVGSAFTLFCPCAGPEYVGSFALVWFGFVFFFQCSGVLGKAGSISSIACSVSWAFRHWDRACACQFSKFFLSLLASAFKFLKQEREHIKWNQRLMWLIFSGDCISSNLDLSLIIYLQGKHWATLLMLGISGAFFFTHFWGNCCCHKEVRRDRGLLFANVCWKTYLSCRNMSYDKLVTTL